MLRAELEYVGVLQGDDLVVQRRRDVERRIGTKNKFIRLLDVIVVAVDQFDPTLVDVERFVLQLVVVPGKLLSGVDVQNLAAVLLVVRNP